MFDGGVVRPGSCFRCYRSALAGATGAVIGQWLRYPSPDTSPARPCAATQERSLGGEREDKGREEGEATDSRAPVQKSNLEAVSSNKSNDIIMLLLDVHTTTYRLNI
jgi:hypothetical protein